MDMRAPLHRVVSVLDDERGKMTDAEWSEYLGAIRSVVDVLEERLSMTGSGWQKTAEDTGDREFR